MMNKNTILFSFLLLIVFIACSEIPFGLESAKISLQINIEGQFRVQGHELSKATTIQTVKVTVSGADMETVTANLNFDISAGSATGTITVPQGDGRDFLVEGRDQNGLVQFSGNATADLDDAEVNVPVSVYWITPDPITLSVMDFSYNSITLSWSASTASDFGFYLPMISTSPTLTLGDWWRDTTFSDVNKTTLTIDGLLENTTYYVTVVPVDSEGGFRGGSLLDYTNSSTILRRVVTPDLAWLYYDDGTFEDRLFSTGMGDRILTYFNPGGACYVKSMWISLQDNSGVDANYTIIVLDENLNDVLETTPLTTYSGTNELIWKLPWSSRAAGTTGNGFYLGIEYQNTHGYPAVGFDLGSNSMSGYFTDAALGTTTDLTTLGFSGNLGINAIVEYGGSVDGDGLGKRDVYLLPELDDSVVHQFKAQSIAQEPRSVSLNESTEPLHRLLSNQK